MLFPFTQFGKYFGMTSMSLRTSLRSLKRMLPTNFARASLFHSHATSFGFKEVPEEEKSKLVGDVFSSVAAKYDVMNDPMSAGLHRLWKDRLVSELHPFPGMKHLDVVGGTGNVAFRILENINSISRRAIRNAPEEDLQDETQIYIRDINLNMLNVGRKRAIEKGFRESRSLIWVEGDAKALSFQDGTMDSYTIDFGIRNVTHIEKALAEAYRYDYYSFSVIPAVGELVAGDRDYYQYLVESIRRFPPQEKFATVV